MDLFKPHLVGQVDRVIGSLLDGLAVDGRNKGLDVLMQLGIFNFARSRFFFLK